MYTSLVSRLNGAALTRERAEKRAKNREKKEAVENCIMIVLGKVIEDESKEKKVEEKLMNRMRSGKRLNQSIYTNNRTGMGRREQAAKDGNASVYPLCQAS